MLNSFATDNPAAATGAGIVYLTYRSRTPRCRKTRPSVWCPAPIPVTNEHDEPVDIRGFDPVEDRLWLEAEGMA